MNYATKSRAGCGGEGGTEEVQAELEECNYSLKLKRGQS